MSELVIYTDATGTPEAERLALPEPLQTEELRALGWSRRLAGPDLDGEQTEPT